MCIYFLPFQLLLQTTDQHPSIHSTPVGTLLNYQQELACQLSFGLLLVALSNQKESTKGQCTCLPYFCTSLFGTQNKEVSYGTANPDGMCLA
jgi:hypothetical protein